MVAKQRALPVTVRASPKSISQTTRWLGWLAIPWALVALIGGVAILDRLYAEGPLALRLVIVAVALAPGAMAATSEWLGRVSALSWLLAWPQPEARLDLDGMTLILPDTEQVRFDWSDITGMQPANDFQRSTHLLGADGRVIATIPYELAVPRVWRGISRSLAQEVTEARPDRYVVTGRNVLGIPERLALRDAESASADVEPGRRPAIVLGAFFALLGGFGIVVAIIWFTAAASG